ncbi:MAG: tetratricopeptide repeat protein [Fuerstiella sp.]|nr:tetratricopeptide repeat protein [Fuerstiella sp.]
MSSRSPSSIAVERRGGRVRKRRLLVCLALLTSVGLVIWWQDRPLREISALLAEEDFDASLTLANEFLAGHRRDSRAQILKARALTGLGRHDAADALFRRVALESSGFPDDSDALRAWSVSLLSSEKWLRAVSVLEILHQSAPADPETLYRLTVARIRLRQYEDALHSAKQLSTVSGHEEEAHVMIGTIHHDRGNRQAALDAWEVVLNTNPAATNLQISAGEFKAMVGEELLELGFPQRAAEILEESVKTESMARAYTYLGRAYSQTNRQAKASQAWQDALRCDDMDVEAREELANAALRERQPQQAVELMQPLAAANRIKSSSAYVLQRAYAQLQQKENTERWRDRANALREIEKKRSQIAELIRKEKDPFWSGFLHAYDLADQKQWASAERIVSDMLLQHPDADLLRDLAESIRQRNQLPELSRLMGKQY